MILRIIPTDKITDISSEVMRDDGKLKLLPADKWKEFERDNVIVFCHNKARYGIPTIEQNLFIKDVIQGRDAIEIGAGAGDLGFHLRIHMTDNKQQTWPIIKESYQKMCQPVINYPDEIEEIDALEAVEKYYPKVVVGSWITTHAPHQMPYGSNPFGIKEDKIIDLVETFILIGNLDTHWDKPIMKLPHDEIYEDWIVSRGIKQENNRIWIWNRKL